jgi:nicotinamidase-related amidase
MKSFKTAALAATAALALMAAQPSARADIRDPLTPENSVLVYVDLQPQYAFSVHTINATTLVNNATGLAKAAKVFKVPTVFATISAKSFAGPMFDKVAQARPDVTPIDRTVINALDDPRVEQAIAATGRKKIVLGGLWTDSCLVLPALSLLKKGYEVYALADVAGDVDQESHERGMQRVIQAGAVPVTWLPVVLEWQRDWARSETAGDLAQIAKDHGGGWGQGIFYAQEMGVGRK